MLDVDCGHVDKSSIDGITKRAKGSREMKALTTRCVAIISIMVCASSSYATSITTQYNLFIDDFGELRIDGQLVVSASGYGSNWSDPLTLSEGWHDVEILYKNRSGSNGLFFMVREGGAPDVVVPLADMRSQDSAGNWVSGLTAEYYDLSGNHAQTLYGEGPIAHQAEWISPGNLGVRYENEFPAPAWGGIYGPWSLFEERLSGQVLVGAPPIPEPITVLAFGVAVASLGRYIRKRRMA
jgi:hypothetical protein